MKITKVPSPNFTVGRSGHTVKYIVIHVSAGTFQSLDSWFQSTQSQVSAHYGVSHNGEIHEYVDTENTAWHAGNVENPVYKLYTPGTNPNLESVGIEHEGFDLSVDGTQAQKLASAGLIRDICARYGLPLDRDHILGHYQIRGKTKPNCPATNKGVIDELISLAKAGTVTSPTLADGIKMVSDGLAIIKKNSKI